MYQSSKHLLGLCDSGEAEGGGEGNDSLATLLVVGVVIGLVRGCCSMTGDDITEVGGAGSDSGNKIDKN